MHQPSGSRHIRSYHRCKALVASSILSDAVAKKEVRREYLAICSGIPDPTTGTIDAPLARVDGTHLAREVDFSCGDRAITHYKVEKALNDHALVSLQLETGRTHQIRVHMKYIGYPLIGDYLYNPDMRYMKRQALHSYRMSFIHPITKGTYDLYRSSATGYGGCTYLSLSRQVITLFYLFCATIMTIVG